MLKLACPHCQNIGVVPELLMRAGDWPISCHYCHQHYYAPVLSGPETMERQVELNCHQCETVSRLDFTTFTKITEADFELLCTQCHESLTDGITKITHILTEAVAAKDAELTQDSTAMVAAQHHSSSQNSLAPARSLSFGEMVRYLLIGFGFATAAILAAQEGVIDRNWLDQLYALFPEISHTLQMLAKMAGPAS